jgi:hypothetical protein
MTTEINQAKILKSKIRERISSGSTKQEIYNDLILEYSNRKQIAEILDDFVAKKTSEKYKGLNTMLLASLSIIAFIDLAGLNIIAIVIDAFLIYQVYNFNVKYYTWIAVRGFFSIIVVGLILIFNKSLDFNNFNVIVVLIITFLLIAIAFGLGFYLSNRLSPDYKETKEFYVNEDGENRLRYVHEFVD